MFLLWKKVYHNVEEKVNSLFGIKIKFKIESLWIRNILKGINIL